MYTVITKGNHVNRVHTAHYVNTNDFIVVNELGEVTLHKGNPIDWPVHCEIGTQAIVNLKECTLRFGVTRGIMQKSEFVVSIYGDSGTVPKPVAWTDVLKKLGAWPLAESGRPNPPAPKNWKWKYNNSEWVLANEHVTFTVVDWMKINGIEDAQPAPHIFDVINYWPEAHRKCLGTKDLPEGWEWKWFGDDWVLSNGTIGLVRDDWFKYRNKQCIATKEEVMALVDTWPTVHNKLRREITEGWIWARKDNHIVVINQVDNINDGIIITENDWREYLVGILRDNLPVETIAVTAASMLQSALGHMENRAKTYDAPGGERSMGKTVSAFNTITGLQLSEEQGWLFMEILKQVRSQQGNYRADNYEDMVAYAALRGECAARERGDN